VEVMCHVDILTFREVEHKICKMFLFFENIDDVV